MRPWRLVAPNRESPSSPLSQRGFRSTLELSSERVERCDRRGAGPFAAYVGRELATDLRFAPHRLGHKAAGRSVRVGKEQRAVGQVEQAQPLDPFVEAGHAALAHDHYLARTALIEV